MIENAYTPEAVAYNLMWEILKSSQKPVTKELILSTYKDCLGTVKHGIVPQTKKEPFKPKIIK